MVLPHLKNWSLNHLRLKRQSQCNKKLTLIIQLWSSGVNQDVFSHLPGKSYRLPSLPGAVHPALGSGVLADGWGVGGKGRVSAMCRDLNPNSPAAVWPPVAPAPIGTNDYRLAAVNYPSQINSPAAFHIWKSPP